MKAIVRGLLTVLTVVVSLGLAGVTPAVAQEAIVACVPTVWQLTAGQTIPVGAVTVRNDRENIYVRYKLSDDKAPNACFGALHLWGGTDLANVPTNNQATQSLANFRIPLMPADRGSTRSQSRSPIASSPHAMRHCHSI